MPGGSSSDRRKRKRLSGDVVEETSKALTERFTLTAALPAPKQTRRFSIGSMVGLIIAILSIPAIIYGFQPKFSVTPLGTLDPDRLFATPFSLRNTGIFDAMNLTVGCLPVIENVASYGKTVMKDVEFTQPPIPRLPAGESGATIQCHAIKSDIRLKLGEQFPVHFWVDGRYGYSWANWHFHKEYTYLATGDSSGHVSFQEHP